MAYDAHSNLAISTVDGTPPGTGGTSLDVSTGDGAFFPAVPFNATVWASGVSPDRTNAEIIRVTARSGDSFTTIVRNQEEAWGPRDIGAGDMIAATLTAKTITEIESGQNIQSVLAGQVFA